MKERIRALASWCDARTGLGSGMGHFLSEEIPASAGWAQVFGSVALFLFGIQAATGILLALNYAPTAGEAYNSIGYIMREVTTGRMIHGLHHWGASAMVIVVVIHMAQVFLYGAYKKPREATWMAGVVLLLVTLGFGLTGYLLPWDNKAYWGTVVTTQIAGQAPGLGHFLKQMLGAEDGVGAITFARFYALHTLVLPAVMVALVVLHVALVRRHGVAPAPDDNRPKRRFYPEQAFRDVVAVFLTFSLLFMAAALFDTPLGKLADPTDTTYVPRPEWYFLFLFQTLKLFQGPLEPVGSVVLPTLALIALAAVPFIDRGSVRLLKRRTIAGSVLLAAVAGWTALTAAAIRSTPKEARETPAPPARGWNEFSAQETAGIAYFQQEHCESCHNLSDGNPKVGPTLAGEGRRRSASWLIQHFKDPGRMMPGSNMPPITLGTSELNALSAFLLKLTPENAVGLDRIDSKYLDGAKLYVANGCGSCHKVNGLGGEVGPALNGLSGRRAREWVAEHFADPKKLSPGSTMPSYRFSATEADQITAYLFSLP